MRKPSQKFAGIKEDILGAGFHILGGAGGDLKLLVSQLAGRVLADQYVTRAEYEALLARLAILEGKKPAKANGPGKTVSKAKPKPTRKLRK
jgi:hypothetical protein